VIEVVEQTGSAATANFTYLVPSLPNASVTVMASEGDSFRGAASVAHRDGITNAQNTIPLELPTPPVPVGGQGAITPETTMSWSGSQKTYVWRAESADWYEGVYVVTSRKSITMPTFANGFALRSGEEASWRVETHGNAATVDELAGPQGFADSFGASMGSGPSGPRRDSGTYSISMSRRFTMY
jgi:hypothetical protein